MVEQAAAAPARCRKSLRGSFMASPHELECLQQIRKVSEPRSNEFRITRLPKAQSLPLISQNVGMSRWQLAITLHRLPTRVEGPHGWKRQPQSRDGKQWWTRG